MGHTGTVSKVGGRQGDGCSAERCAVAGRPSLSLLSLGVIDAERLKRRARWFLAHTVPGPADMVSRVVTKAGIVETLAELRRYRGWWGGVRFAETVPEGRSRGKFLRRSSEVSRALKRGARLLSESQWLWDCGSGEDWALHDMAQRALWAGDVHASRAQALLFAWVTRRNRAAAVAGRDDEIWEIRAG